MNNTRMSSEIKEITHILDSIINTPIGKYKSSFKDYGFGWWGNENSSRLTLQGNPFYDSLICHFDDFEIKISKLQNNVFGNDNIQIIAESVNYNPNEHLINETLDELTSILVRNLPQIKFNKHRFYSKKQNTL